MNDITKIRFVKFFKTWFTGHILINMGDYILITGAVADELSPFYEVLDSPQSHSVGRRSVVHGKLGNLTLRLIETGPGMMNTAQSLTAMLETDIPRLVIMTGCAGGFQQAGMNVGDVGIATAEIDAQIGIEGDDNMVVPAPLPFSIGKVGGKDIKNCIELNSELSMYAGDLIRGALHKEGTKLSIGPFITVSTITATDRRASLLFKQYHACMESMEGAAGAYVAGYYGIPFLEIRGASNVVGNRQRDAWNIPLACQRSSSAIISFLFESNGRWPS